MGIYLLHSMICIGILMCAGRVYKGERGFVIPTFVLVGTLWVL